MIFKFEDYLINDYDTTENGNKAVGVSVWIYKAGTDDLAVLFNDVGVAVDNPVVTNEYGYYSFSIEAGHYDFVVNKDTDKERYLYTNKSLADALNIAIDSDIYEIEEFSGSVIEMPYVIGSPQVEIDGKVVPPSFYKVDQSGYIITLEFEIKGTVPAVVRSTSVGGTSSGDSSVVYLSDFNIDDVGNDNDAANLKAAIEKANSEGKKVLGGRNLQIKLLGDDEIIINTEIDFDGATLDISQWAGNFRIENSLWNTYTAGSPVFDNLVNTGIMDSDKVAGWDGLNQVNNSYVKVNSSNYHYTYRNIDFTHTEYNACTTRGKCESIFLNLDSSNLTSVDVLKIPSKRLGFGNFKLYIGDKILGNKFLDVINSAAVDIHDIKIESEDIIFTDVNPTFISLFDCAFITLKNLNFNKPFQADTPDRFVYGVRMEYCYNIKHDNLKGYGEGWGILGSNSSRLIYYTDCMLNRIDFHKPLVELLQVDNCTVGSWGMLLTTIGDVKVYNSTFINNQTDYFGQRAYIAANDSAGGFANGDLILDNCKFRSADKELMLLYVNKANDTGGIRYPSAIEKQCWNRVIVTNCDFGKGYQTAVMPGIEDDNGMRWPSEFTMRDCTGDILVSRNLLNSLPRWDIRNDETELVKPHNLFVTLDNVETVYDEPLYLGDRRDQNFKIKMNINNVRATQNDIVSGVTLSLVFGGDVSITNSLVEGFNFFETNQHFKPLNINIDTTTVNYIGRFYDDMFKNPAPRSSITASNCTFIGDINTVKDVARITTNGCKMKINTSPTFYNAVAITDSSPVLITNGSTAFKNSNVPTNWEQSFELGISVGSGGAYRVPLTLKDENAKYTIPIGSGYITVRRVGVGIEVENQIGAATNLYYYYVNKLLN